MRFSASLVPTRYRRERRGHCWVAADVTGLQCQLDRDQDGLQPFGHHRRQYLGHDPVSNLVAQQVSLERLEALGDLAKGRAVAQGSRFALQHPDIVLPVIQPDQ